MILDAWEKDPHGVRPVVQMRDAGSVQVAGELVDVRLKLGKGCERRGVNILKKGTNRKKKALIFIVLVSVSGKTI